MRKIKNNTTNSNPTIINVLNQNIKDKIKARDELVRTHNLYGIFLSNNTFVIAKEISDQKEYCTVYTLENFFTERIVTYTVVDNAAKLHLPWEGNKKFIPNLDLEAIAFPIVTFLNNHIEHDVTTKRNITVLVNAVNEYIRENPTFIDSVFKENVYKR